MKHIWEITPRGRKTKYYTCTDCGVKIASTSKKTADWCTPPCRGIMGRKDAEEMNKIIKNNKGLETQSCLWVVWVKWGLTHPSPLI